MFNAEKLLGGLLMGSNRRGSLSRLVSGGVGLGLLGVAMEAAEHFTKKQTSFNPTGPPSAPPAPGRSIPGSPPPIPGAAPPPPPAPPPVPETRPSEKNGSGTAHDSKQEKDAVLLIRAMIAAANADGVIDRRERGRVLKRLKALDLSELEHTFIEAELSSPEGLDQIVSQVDSPETADKVYAASLMALDVDTDAERRYLDGLADRLNIAAERRKWIHEKLGVTNF